MKFPKMVQICCSYLYLKVMAVCNLTLYTSSSLLNSPPRADGVLLQGEQGGPVAGAGGISLDIFLRCKKVKGYLRMHILYTKKLGQLKNVLKIVMAPLILGDKAHLLLRPKTFPAPDILLLRF